MQGKWYPSLASLTDLIDEVVRARAKFPHSKFLLTALGEEFGELCRAFLQQQGPERVREEALQVACLAMRIYEESDPLYDNMTPEESKP